ncbi:MAG: porin family protein [Chitinophagaceae bacterium]
MKKILLALVVLTTTVLASQAQVRFGLKAGANFYTIGGDDAEGEDINSKFGLHVGGLVNIPVSAKFKVQPEVVFSIQGAKEDNGGPGNLNLNYVNIPIMAQVYATEGLYFELGPQIGFLLKADSKDETTGVSVSVKDQLKSTDFGVGLGAGYTMASGFGFNARYNLGLSNIVEAAGSELKNRGFQLGVSFLFGGSKGGEAKK